MAETQFTVLRHNGEFIMALGEGGKPVVFDPETALALAEVITGELESMIEHERATK